MLFFVLGRASVEQVWGICGRPHEDGGVVFGAASLGSRNISDDALSSITKLDPKAGQILAAAATESDAASEPERAAPTGRSPVSRQMADRMDTAE